MSVYVAKMRQKVDVRVVDGLECVVCARRVILIWVKSAHERCLACIDTLSCNPLCKLEHPKHSEWQVATS